MDRLPGMRSGRAHRGLGRIEVAVIIVVIVIALSTALVVLSVPYGGPAETRDATQLRQILASLVTFSGDVPFDGEYPLPSRLVLRGRQYSGEQSSATGEDFTLNHSANIYSTLIMMNYLTPQILVSPVETSSHVRVMGQQEGTVEYDWDAYDPVNGVFWDDAFVMHIHDPAVGANGSYAHLAAVGDRRRLHWRHTSDPTVPIVGTRAPARGFGPGHPASAQWVGTICYADNHIEHIENFFPADLPAPMPDDNIYAADHEHPKGPQAAADAFLAIYISATEFTVEDVYDPLETD